MALYKYIAAAIGRETQEVVIEADNAGEALNKLRSSGLRPVRFCGETDVAAGAKSFMTRSKVDAYEFTEQLGTKRGLGGETGRLPSGRCLCRRHAQERAATARYPDKTGL